MTLDCPRWPITTKRERRLNPGSRRGIGAGPELLMRGVLWLGELGSGTQEPRGTRETRREGPAIWRQSCRSSYNGISRPASAAPLQRSGPRSDSARPSPALPSPRLHSQRSRSPSAGVSCSRAVSGVSSTAASRPAGPPRAPSDAHSRPRRTLLLRRSRLKRLRATGLVGFHVDRLLRLLRRDQIRPLVAASKARNGALIFRSSLAR